MNHSITDKTTEIIRGLADNNPGILFQVEFQKQEGFRLAYVCERIHALSGWSPDQVVEKPERLGGLIEHSERQRLEALFQEAAQDGEAFSFDTQVKVRQGKRWYHVQVIPWAQGERPIVFNGVAMDITPQKQKEQELEHTQTLLNKTLDSIEEAVFMIGPGHRQIVQSCNRAVEKVFGFSQEELAGETTEKIHVNREMFKRFGEVSEPELESRGRFETEYQMRRKDGEIIETYNTVTVLDSDQGWQGGVVSTVRDITGIKQTEQALREGRQRYRSLVEDINDILYRTDENGVITYMSPVAGTLGYDPAELVGGHFEELIHPEDRAQIAGQFEDARTGYTEPSEYRIMNAAGKPVWVRTSSKPLFKAGRFVGLQGVATDISQEKQLQDQLQQAQKLEAIGTLAGGVAHDFNNILSSVMGYTQLTLQDIPRGSEQYDNLSEVLSAADRAKDLVQQILIFSRREEPEIWPIQINPLVKEALKMLRSTLPTSIEFREDIYSEPLTVNADPTSLHQVIVNLATNAKQALADQTGVLEVSVAPIQLDQDLSRKYRDLSPGHYARITVSDTGKGIAPEHLNRIFEPYFTTKKKGVGTGLGLPVVHGIVKSMKGHITVYSEPGQGTTFHVYLPLASQEQVQVASSSDGPIPQGKERILIVDDDPAIANILKQHLERWGYQVTSTTSSTQAMEIFLPSPKDFDLVLTDMTMPRMTGDQLATQIKEVRPDLPVILCTGYSEKISGREATLDIDGFLMKPVQEAELAKTVRQVLDER